MLKKHRKETSCYKNTPLTPLLNLLCRCNKKYMSPLEKYNLQRVGGAETKFNKAVDVVRVLF